MIVFKNYKRLNKQKVFLVIIECLIGSVSAISCCTFAKLSPSAGNIISSSTALLTSFATLITNEYNSKKVTYTKLRVWFIVNTLLDEKTLKQFMIYENFNQ